MYHRVSKGISAEGISVNVLRRQLEEIKRNFTVISLSDLVELSIKDRIPDNSVALTFDDGYRDFYDCAYPLLKELELPAIIFLTTGFVNGDLWLWPDKIKYIINETKLRYFEFESKVYDLSVLSQRIKAWNDVGDICLSKDNPDKLNLIAELSNRLDVSLPKDPPKGFEGLTWVQIREMIDSALISVGSHSVSHPIMTKIDEPKLEYELAESKRIIEAETGVKVLAFCYPNGQKSDSNEYTRLAVRRAGYSYALVAYSSLYPLNNIWEISRYTGSSKNTEFEKALYGLKAISRKVSSCL